MHNTGKAVISPGNTPVPRTAVGVPSDTDMFMTIITLLLRRPWVPTRYGHPTATTECHKHYCTCCIVHSFIEKLRVQRASLRRPRNVPSMDSQAATSIVIHTELECTGVHEVAPCPDIELDVTYRTQYAFRTRSPYRCIVHRTVQ